jgi:hypothetical protein
MQVLAPHHREPWLLDLALLAEKARPWPLLWSTSLRPAVAAPASGTLDGG